MLATGGVGNRIGLATGGVGKRRAGNWRCMATEGDGNRRGSEPQLLPPFPGAAGKLFRKSAAVETKRSLSRRSRLPSRRNTICSSAPKVRLPSTRNHYFPEKVASRRDETISVVSAPSKVRLPWRRNAASQDVGNRRGWQAEGWQLEVYGNRRGWQPKGVRAAAAATVSGGRR